MPKQLVEIGDDMALDERTRKSLDTILETIEKRKETFGKAVMGFAFSRDDSALACP